VPVRLTEEYARMWPHAERVTIAHTGHLGLITRPGEFAEAVVPFADRCDAAHRTVDPNVGRALSGAPGGPDKVRPTAMEKKVG